MSNFKLAGVSLVIFGLISVAHAGTDGTHPLSGLLAPASITRDADYIPHIVAENDHDAYFLMGYLHARDRFFQMDLLRRTAGGTSAELLGASALPSDIQSRTIGFRRAAEASVRIFSPKTVAVLQAYADGVNAWLRDPNTALPPEYAALNLTKASMPAWTVTDSEAISKQFAGSFGVDEDAT